MRETILLLIVAIVMVDVVVAEVPKISDVSVDIQPEYVKITWVTDVEASSKVEYGLEALTETKTRSGNSKIHIVYLAGLTRDNTYKFRVTSCNDDGCDSSSVLNFSIVEPDTTNPVLELAEFNESLVMNESIQLMGSVNEPCNIIIMVNDNTTINETAEGNFSYTVGLVMGENHIRVTATDEAGNSVNKELSFTADPEPTQLLEINLDQLDMSTNTQQTLKGKVNKPNVKITAIVEGRSFNGISNENGNFEMNIQLTGSGSAQERLNSVKVIAEDEFGRVDVLVEGSITFIKCGSGSGWTTRLYDLTPDVLIPEHLINGIAQFGFSMDFEYVGPGKNAYMEFEPSVELQPMSEAKREASDEELFAGAVVQCSDDRSSCYFVVNLAPWYSTREKLANKTWIKLPLLIRIQYVHTVNSRQTPAMMEQCVDINLMLDKRWLDIYKPNELLNASINFFNSTIKTLESIRKPIETVKSVTIGACGVALAADFFTRIGMGASCLSGKEAAVQAYHEGKKSCPSDAPDGCQTCLDALWGVRVSESTRNWLCDRLFCPSVPTLEKHKETYTDPLTGMESRCKLRADKACEDEYKYAWDSAGLFIDEWSKAKGIRKQSFFDELDFVIQQSNEFCPAIKGIPEQVVRVGTTDYFIDENRQVWIVVPRRLAQRQGQTVEVYNEEYTIVRGPLQPGQDLIPDQILELIKEEDKTKEYIFDPTSGPFEALMGGCLPAITGYISHWENIAEAVKQCLEMVKLNGEGTPGICKAILSQYVCDAIWDTVRCLGGGLTAGSQNARVGFDSGFMNTASMISQAGRTITDSISNRYGETAMYDVMFRQRKLIHSACIGFFTGDLAEFDLNAMFSAEVGMPVLQSEALVSPATRRFLTSNPFQQGWATFVYHIGYGINAGSDLSYSLKLHCSNDVSCPDFNESSGACDCFARGEPVEKVIASGSASAGDFISDEKYIKLTEPVRFDKAILEWTWTDNNGNERSDRVVKSISVVGATPPSYCKFNPNFGEYRCKSVVGKEGIAFFIGHPIPVSHEGRSNPVVFIPGDKIELTGQIGVEIPEDAENKTPKFLTMAVLNHHNKFIASKYVMLDTTGNYQLSQFPQLWPLVSKQDFVSESGVSDCENYDVNHPATWKVYIVIYKAAKNPDTGAWERTDEVVMYQGQPQYYEIPIYVACTEEAISVRRCADGLISQNTENCWCMSGDQRLEIAPSDSAYANKYCCNGKLSDTECQAPEISSVLVRVYRKEAGEQYLLAQDTELQDLADNAELLMPNSNPIISFPTITVSDDSEVTLYFILDGSEVELGKFAAGTTSYSWQPDMGGADIKSFDIQFKAVDDSGLETVYPIKPKTVQVKRSSYEPFRSS